MGNRTDIFLTFLRLGLTSFGGPVAHIGYLRETLVQRKKWVDDATFADLTALCQFLPGPASSQLVFALGRHRGGWSGALLASLAFTLPSALLMLLAAYGFAAMDPGLLGPALRGLLVAAVVVVAQAVWSMARTLCPDLPRFFLALVAGAVLVRWPGAATQVAVMAAGAGCGAWWFPTSPRAQGLDAYDHGSRRGGVVALWVWLVLLVALPLLVHRQGAGLLSIFDSFFRAGSLVFGGGHVILPLLRAELVPAGWVDDGTFLAGYGAAQALPGPLFTFAAYLGGSMASRWPAWLTGLWCLLGIFLPAWLLVGGVLPFWHRLRALPLAQAAMRGANAAVVGVLMAALYQPVASEGLREPADAVLGVVLWYLLARRGWPSWAVVLCAAAAGMGLHAIGR